MAEAKDDLKTSQGIIIGSPTILGEALPPIYEAMSGLNPIINKGMYALSFGSYAWSGEAALNINNCFKLLKFNTPFDPIRVKLNPSDYDLEQIKEVAGKFAKKVIEE